MSDCFWCTVCNWAFGVVAAVWVACYLRIVPVQVMRAWFVVVAIFNVLVMAVLAAIVDLLLLVGVSRRVTQTINTFICRVTFAGIVRGTSQVRVHMDAGSWETWCSVPKKSAVTLNHTSFWDAFLFVGISPWSYVYNARTLMKDSLRKIPIFGSIFNRVGHFPVYFKSDEDGNFSVDKERQAPVMEKVLKHLQHGGRICLFPEGAVNKTPRQLKSFRRGSFGIILENKLPVYYFITVGNDETWPSGAAIGGLPADIYVSCNKFDIDFEKDTAESVAERLQIAMQKEVDRLYALREKELGGKYKKRD